MENAQIADLLDEIADLLELTQANEFRVRSYRNVARAVRDQSQRLEDMVARGAALTEVPGVGPSTAEKIAEIVETGTCARLEELRGQVPPGLTELMNVPSLGPRKAMKIYKELGVESLADLRRACEEHRLREIEGMGEKSEQKVLDGLHMLEKTAGRILLKRAADHVDALARHLKGCAAVDAWEVAGSFRRRAETVGDLDVLVRAADREAATEQILAYRPIAEVIGRGAEKASVRLDSGLQVDFRFVEPASFGAALMYFTGSKAHNIALRKCAVERDWKLNEYGLFDGDELLAGDSEEPVYARLGMQWIPPELREDRGEIEAAAAGELPALVELSDIRGNLHSHTTASDGALSVEDLAQAARRRGYRYLAITDHSKLVRVANGLDEDRLRAHADHIREVDGSLDDFWLLTGVEVDILKDGRLDLDEDVLAGLDWVVASVHYNLAMEREAATERVVRAVRSGVVHCLGHPLGRIIGRREQLALDLDRVLGACAECGVAVEINAQPDRLDLPDIHCRQASDAGVAFSIATDAHKENELDFMQFGVDVARRGWLTKHDVLNTLTERQLRKRLPRG